MKRFVPQEKLGKKARKQLDNEDVSCYHLASRYRN